MSEVPAEFRDFAFNSAEVVDVNQEIQSTDEWALKNLDYVRSLITDLEFKYSGPQLEFMVLYRRSSDPIMTIPKSLADI